MQMSPAGAPAPQLSAIHTRPNFKRLLLLAQLAGIDSRQGKFSQLPLGLGRFMFSALAAFAVFVVSHQSAGAAPPDKLPELKVVLDYVDRHFANTTDFKPGDILSTSNVAPLFDGLELIGWNVPDRKALLERIPSDNDYVVRQLRTEAGRKFMQQVGGLPLGYDRLFRLARLSHGRQQVKYLIDTKDGYKMIEYMTTTKNGKNLGNQLSHAQSGADFNKPTGQIYTVDALKAELEKSYQKTVQALAK